MNGLEALTLDELAEAEDAVRLVARMTRAEDQTPVRTAAFNSYIEGEPVASGVPS